MKALIVEYNVNNLLLENDLLENAGYEVFTAATANLGIVMAKKEQPDIIIMDVRLPDMNGTNAARILKKDIETCHIPIVFVTASVTADGMEEISTVQDAGFIGKPINTRTFVDQITQYIKKGLRR